MTLLGPSFHNELWPTIKNHLTPTIRMSLDLLDRYFLALAHDTIVYVAYIYEQGGICGRDLGLPPPLMVEEKINFTSIFIFIPHCLSPQIPTCMRVNIQSYRSCQESISANDVNELSACIMYHMGGGVWGDGDIGIDGNRIRLLIYQFVRSLVSVSGVSFRVARIDPFLGSNDNIHNYIHGYVG